MKKLVAVAAAVLAVMAAACSGKDTATTAADNDLVTQSDTLAYYNGRMMGASLLTNAMDGKFDKEPFLFFMDKSLTMSESEILQLRAKMEAEYQTANAARKKQLESEGAGLSVGMMMRKELAECRSKSGDTLSMKKFMVGFKEVMEMNSVPDVTIEREYLDAFMKKVSHLSAEERALANRNYVEGVNYLKEAMTADPSIKKTVTGLAYKVIREGHGVRLERTQKVSVRFVCRRINGTIVDNPNWKNAVEAAPNHFSLIPGLREGLLMMNLGSVYRFYIPGNLAYGETGYEQYQIGPNEMLVFDVEVQKIK